MKEFPESDRKSINSSIVENFLVKKKYDVLSSISSPRKPVKNKFFKMNTVEPVLKGKINYQKLNKK